LSSERNLSKVTTHKMQKDVNYCNKHNKKHEKT
jgi:hypothetical protein